MFGRLTLAFIGALLLVGCQTGATRTTGENHWHTKIYRGVGENPDLKAVAHTTMTYLTPERTRASVTLPGLLPRGEYAWGVYEGNCTSQGGIMGSESDYPMLVPDENSMGSFTATINDSFDSSGTYSLSIFRTGGARDEVLGCNVMRQGALDEEDVEI